jgi:membrane-associated phospholipid phosphatase
MGQVIARTPVWWPLGALTGFAALLALVAAGWAPLHGVDLGVSEAFRAYGTAHPGVVGFARVATDVMSTVSYLVLGCLSTVALAATGRFRVASFVAAITVAVPTAWGLLHWVLHRPRPVAGFVTVASNGFPSGHTMNAGAAALAAVLLLWPRLGRAGRCVVVPAAVLFAGAVGLSRVMLLAHWPSDVLGGWLLAAAVVPPLAGLAASGADRAARRVGSDRARRELGSGDGRSEA